MSIFILSIGLIIFGLILLILINKRKIENIYVGYILAFGLIFLGVYLIIKSTNEFMNSLSF